MQMDWPNRIGLGGLILTLFSLAAAILWPDKKIVGWLSLAGAATLTVTWVWLEVRTPSASLFRTHPIGSTIAIFLVAGSIAATGWLWIMRSIQPIKPVTSSVDIAPAGFISFFGQVINGLAPMMQENQTPTPLDDVRLSIIGSVPDSDTDWNSTGRVFWKKQIDIGTVRALLSAGLLERFPVGGQKRIQFFIFMETRLRSYIENIYLTKTSETEYEARMEFGKPVIYSRTMMLRMVEVPRRQQSR